MGRRASGRSCFARPFLSRETFHFKRSRKLDLRRLSSADPRWREATRTPSVDPQSKQAAHHEQRRGDLGHPVFVRVVPKLDFDLEPFDAGPVGFETSKASQ